MYAERKASNIVVVTDCLKPIYSVAWFGFCNHSAIALCHCCNNSTHCRNHGLYCLS